MQGAGSSTDDVRVVVQALNNWCGQIRSNEVHLLKSELNAGLDYAAGILESDEQMRNELCIARSLLALNQVVSALQRLEGGTSGKTNLRLHDVYTQGPW